MTDAHPSGTGAPAAARSLAAQAAIAVLFLLGFYLLALVMAALLLSLPFAEWHFFHHVTLLIATFGVLGAVAIVVAAFPWPDRFPDPGPRLTAEGQPRLFGLLEAVARETGQAMPRDVFLVLEPNAFVAQRGGILGFGSHRVMGLGLPLLLVLTPDQLRAVLAHEFGHYVAGDTALGPLLYRTRAAFARTLELLSYRHAIVGLPFQWYGSFFLRVTQATSRAQELTADALGARVGGVAAMAAGLHRIHTEAALFELYWIVEVIPALDAGFRPPVMEGFARFLRAGEVVKARAAAIEEERAAADGDRYDSHPPLPARLAALGVDPADAAAADGTGSAASLLEGHDQLEHALILALDGERGAALKDLGWAEMGLQVWVPRWQAKATECAGKMAGLRVNDVAEYAGAPERLMNRLELALGVVPLKAYVAEASVRVGGALAVLLHRGGWLLTAEPGEHVRFERDGMELRPLAAAAELFGGELTPEGWRAMWAAVGMGEVDLGTAGVVEGVVGDGAAAG
jgi:Zn-dependent protease with chaperone function